MIGWRKSAPGDHCHARLRINVKEIYDKCWELGKDAQNVIFNQFDEFGNPILHYEVTGSAIEEVFNKIKERNRAAAISRRPVRPVPSARANT